MFNWFILNRDQVAGPFSTEEIKSNVKSGLFDSQCLIWGHPQEEWKGISWWMNEAETHQYGTLPIKTLMEWHFAVAGEAHGPLPWEKLLSELRKIEQKEDLMLWTKGQKQWTSIFDFPDVMKALGMDRRQHTRAPIVGHVIVRVQEQIIIGKLVDISQGGFGVTQMEGLTKGQIVDVYIKSENFREDIHAKAEVRYLDRKGYTGFRFDQIHMEAKSTIIDYVRGKERKRAS